MSRAEKLDVFAREIGCSVTVNAPMSEYTTFKTGGSAALLAEPQNEKALSLLLSKCAQEGIKPYIVGNGSNLLVDDGGIDSVVIKIGDGLSEIRMVDETTVECGAGLSLSRLCRFALEKGLSGLEFAFGIPGSVGGAVFMNAGAYGGEMGDVLVSCRHMDQNGVPGELSLDEMNLGYRKSIYRETGFVVVSARFKLQKGDKEEIKAKMDDFLNRRKSKQPLELPSAGSTFKRPEGHFAGALIEQCGLKGLRVGGAQVSEKHAGFIVNNTGATSGDIVALIELVQKRVFEETGILLEPEVIKIP